MENMATRLDDKLPEFEKYLLGENLAPANHVPVYAYWVSLFFNDTRRNEISAQEAKRLIRLEHYSYSTERNYLQGGGETVIGLFDGQGFAYCRTTLWV